MYAKKAMNGVSAAPWPACHASLRNVDTWPARGSDGACPQANRRWGSRSTRGADHPSADRCRGSVPAEGDRRALVPALPGVDDDGRAGGRGLDGVDRGQRRVLAVGAPELAGALGLVAGLPDLGALRVDPRVLGLRGVDR